MERSLSRLLRSAGYRFLAPVKSTELSAAAATTTVLAVLPFENLGPETGSGVPGRRIDGRSDCGTGADRSGAAERDRENDDHAIQAHDEVARGDRSRTEVRHFWWRVRCAAKADGSG